MINIKQKRSHFSLALLMTGIIIPACYAQDAKVAKQTADKTAAPAKTNSKVILSRDGKPLLTEEDFNDFIARIAEAENSVKVALDLQPEQTKCNLLEALERSVIMQEWAISNKVRSSSEYVKEEEQMLKHIRNMLDYKEFVKKHPVDVSDAEVKAYYDTNKEAQMRMAAAGVRASGVQFDNREAAQAFAEKVRKESDMDIAKVAEDAKVRVQNFGIVNKDSSHVDKEVRDQLDSIKKFPSVDVVIVNDSKYWVTKSLSKQDAEYFPFDKVQGHIKQMLVSEKTNKMLEEKVPMYKKQLNIESNKEYMDALKCKKEEAEKKDQEAVLAAAKKAEASK